MVALYASITSAASTFMTLNKANDTAEEGIQQKRYNKYKKRNLDMKRRFQLELTIANNLSKRLKTTLSIFCQFSRSNGRGQDHRNKQCLAGVLTLEIHPFRGFGLNYLKMRKMHVNLLATVQSSRKYGFGYR